MFIEELPQPLFSSFIVFNEDDAQDLQPFAMKFSINTAEVLEIPDASPSARTPKIEEYNITA
jgi:hypothetical protein